MRTGGSAALSAIALSWRWRARINGRDRRDSPAVERRRRQTQEVKLSAADLEEISRLLDTND